MMKRYKLLPLLILTAALLLAACSGQAPEVTAAAGSIDCAGDGQAVEIGAARLYVEYNATDGDLGVHGGFDDDGWSELCIYAPNGDQIVGVKPQSQLGDLTMASIFFEGREPELSEFSFEDLVAQFPEGQYAVRGLSFDGSILTGAATFTHDIPVEPVITAPALAEDEESAAEATVGLENLVVRWEDVTETVLGGPPAITGYEVIITQVEHEDPNGYSTPIYDVHVPADRYSLSVPAEFLEPGTIYELEVLALESSGNQTISVGFFKTA